MPESESDPPNFLRLESQPKIVVNAKLAGDPWRDDLKVHWRGCFGELKFGLGIPKPKPFQWIYAFQRKAFQREAFQRLQLVPANALRPKLSAYTASWFKLESIDATEWSIASKLPSCSSWLQTPLSAKINGDLESSRADRDVLIDSCAGTWSASLVSFEFMDWGSGITKSPIQRECRQWGLMRPNLSSYLGTNKIVSLSADQFQQKNPTRLGKMLWSNDSIWIQSAGFQDFCLALSDSHQTDEFKVKRFGDANAAGDSKRLRQYWVLSRILRFLESVRKIYGRRSF